MKNKKYLFALVPFLSILVTSCSITDVSGSSKVENNIEQNIDNDKLKGLLNEGEVILNLTPNGLYNGSKGELLQDYFVENGVIYKGSVGDTLPNKDEVSSIVNNNELSSWVYINDSGELNFTTTIVEDIYMYHAYWKYTGDYNETSSSTSTTSQDSSTQITTSDTTTSVISSSTTSEETTSVVEEENIVTLYFLDKSWWNADAASTSIHYWGDAGATTWPGMRMEWISYDAEEGTNLWKFDLDISKYTNFMFVRTHSQYQLEDMPAGENADWGAKTVDITYEEGINYYILSDTSVWGDPGAEVSKSFYEA